MKIMKLCVLAALILILLTSVSNAIQRFTVIGTVIDAQTCEPYSNVKVSITQTDNNITVEIMTDSNGKFRKTFTLMGNVIITIQKPGFEKFEQPAYNRIGDTDIGYVALVKTGQPITKVCEKIKNTPLGKELAKYITEIPEIPEEKGLSAKFEEAKTSIELQDFESAIPLLQAEDKQNPENFAVHFYLGYCYYQLKQYDTAIENWAKAVDLSPKRFAVYKNLAKAWEKKGVRTKAAEYMQKVAEIKDDDDGIEDTEKAEAFFDAGIYWYNANNTEKYFESFKKVVDLDETKGDAWYYIGMYYFANQKNKECVEAMEKALLNNVSEENKQTVTAIRDAAKGAIK